MKLRSPVPSSLKLPRTIADLRGQVFRDRYAVDELVGRGPNHAIFSGTDRESERPVLIDIQRPPQLHDAPTARRFEQGVKALGRVKDARVVRPLDSGETADGRFFLVSERPAGQPVDRWVAGAQAERRPWQQAVPVLRQVAQALAAAHSRKVVHGRLHPNACWVSHEDAARPPNVRVLRFGCNLDPAVDDTEATATGTTAFANDAVYMAPETIGGISGDAAADLYLFGLVAYFILAGRPPFCGGNAFVVASMHTRNEVPPLRDQVEDLPPDLAAVVHSLLAKLPQERPSSIASVDEVLGRFDSASSTQQASPADVGGAGATPGRRKAGRRGRAKRAAAQRAAVQRPAVGNGGERAPRDRIASRLSSGRTAPPPSRGSAGGTRRRSPSPAPSPGPSPAPGPNGPTFDVSPPRVPVESPPASGEDLAATETFSREALRAAMPSTAAGGEPPEATMVLGGTPVRDQPVLADVAGTEMLPRFLQAPGTGLPTPDATRQPSSPSSVGVPPQSTEVLDLRGLRAEGHADPLTTDVLMLEIEDAVAAPLSRPIVNVPHEAPPPRPTSPEIPAARQVAAPGPMPQPVAPPGGPPQQRPTISSPPMAANPPKSAGVAIWLIAGSIVAIVAGIAAGAWLAG